MITAVEESDGQDSFVVRRPIVIVSINDTIGAATALRPYLTDIEYLRVEDQPGNVAQVDELVQILLTKENRHFDGLCRVLEHNGYRHWAQRLRAAAGGHRHAVEPEGT